MDSRMTPSRDRQIGPAAPPSDEAFPGATLNVESDSSAGPLGPDAERGRIRVRLESFSYGRVGPLGGSPYGPAPIPVLDDEKNDESPALADILLDAAPGTLTLLCGSSGSGKSTVLRLLNGLVPHFHAGRLIGEVRVSGVDVPATDLSQAGRTTSTVFQNPRTQFFTPLVSSELAFRGENYGIAPDEIISASLLALEELGIADLWTRPLSSLSGGELQKVACAQAMAAGTPVLLLDEPTSNLSPAAIREFTRILEGMKASGMTIVIAEHRLHFLREFVDEALLIEGGRILRRWSGEEFRLLEEGDRIRFGLRTLTAPADPLSDPGWARARETGAVTAAASRSMTKEAAEDAGEMNEDAALRGLEVRDLRFSYGRRRVLDIESLSFPSGSVTAVVGDNGAGKSTLCRVLVGLERAERGTWIGLDGARAGAGARLAASAMVMQDVHRQLFSDTVRGEVVLGLTPDHLGGVDVEALLERFALAEFADRHPLSLSGGQKQRLTVAAAVARGARVHVFDEPTSGVDHRQLVEIGAQLRDIAEGGGVVIVVTHDPELVAECADRIVHLRPLDASLAEGRPQAELLIRVGS